MRFLRPSIAVFVVALLASLCIHFPIYEALGELADRLLHSEPKRAVTTVEFELAPLGKSDVPEPKPKAAELPTPKEKHAKKEPPPPAPQAPRPQPQPQPDSVKPVPLQPEIVQAVPVPVQPRPDNPLAVTQKSDNPDVAPPEDARFIAEENRRVEQESIAHIRDMQRDDPTPMANASPKQSSEDEGNSDKTAVEDLQDVHGSNERTPNKTEATTKPVHASEPSAGKREAQAVPAPAVTQAPSKAVNPQRASGAPESGGQPETIVVQDGVGSFTIRKQPQGRGPGEAGSAQNPGEPSPDRNNRQGARAQNGVNLRLSWTQFEDTYGADDLEAQRAAYLEQRKSSASGHSRQVKWKEFRAAIENFVPNVQPGTQTALNTAADPFANWLAEAHRRIHREFAFGFLRSLPLAGGPFADPTLHTELEIVINGDGSVHKVGIAESSGFLPFDYGAFDSVMRAAPYPLPPRKILSGDGRVYVHWGFYRNERQCGTFNARPYILPHPAGTPEPGKGPLHDDEAPPKGPPASSPAAGDGEFGALDRSRILGDVRR